MTTKIPTIKLSDLQPCCLQPIEVHVELLQNFLQGKELIFPHRHAFYQILYITKGSGQHIIDFETFEVQIGQLYFLSPEQIHDWRFSEDIEGVLINFTDCFFSSFLSQSNYLKKFRFFKGHANNCIVDLSATDTGSHIKSLLNLCLIYNEDTSFRSDLLRSVLIQLFNLVEQTSEQVMERLPQGAALSLYHKFEELIEIHYKEKHLPKEFAELLHISPNYLNALCMQCGGLSAGEKIRKRILLEIKRSLINSGKQISEIAWELHFEDNSYFSRFFKKYEGITPEEFRKQMIL